MEVLNKCIYCSNKAVKNNLCKHHYIAQKEEEYLDNSDYNSLGIVKWLKDMYPEHYRNEFSKEHKEVYLMFLRLYDPRYINKLQRNRLLIAFRSFAKSKTIFGLISYILTHNNKKIKIITNDNLIKEVTIFEKFIVIFSETGSMAEEFVVNIRDEFTSNHMIKYFYKINIEDALNAIDGQWTKKAFKMNNCYVLGLGAEQQSRGRIKGAYRPTAVFYDDIYSENNTITPESRNKIKKWFRNSSQRTIDDLLGKSLLVGTIVHEDTVLVEAMGSNEWQKIVITPMPIDNFHKFIKNHLEVNIDKGTCTLPHENEFNEFERIRLQKEYFDNVQKQENWGLIWNDRVDLYYLALNYKEAILGKDLQGFYQEYFHLVIPNETKQFSKDYFQKIDKYEIFNEFGMNWIRYNGEVYNINIHFGVDIAGFKDSADNSAIVIVGAISNGKYIVFSEVYGKFSMRDVTDNIDRNNIIMDRNQIRKIGYIDELYRQYLIYNPTEIKIGFGGGSEEQIINEIVRIFRNLNAPVMIYPRIQSVTHGKKEDRIKNGLLPKYETYNVYHTNNIKLLEYELEFLGKAKSDDIADSAEVAFFNLKTPLPIDYNTYKNPPKELYVPFKRTLPNLDEWRYI